MDCTETTGMASVRFDCSGGGGTVMFCGRFASGGCVSDRTVSVVIPSCELLLLGSMLLLQLYYYIYIGVPPSTLPLTAAVAGFVVFVTIILILATLTICNHPLLQSKKRLARSFVFFKVSI